MRKMYGQDKFIAGKKRTPTRDAGVGSWIAHERAAPLTVTPLTEAQLQRLIATHLGESVEKPENAVFVLGIAEHVLPSDWTPIR